MCVWCAGVVGMRGVGDVRSRGGVVRSACCMWLVGRAGCLARIWGVKVCG